jgi:hypothetical protein
MMLSKLKLGVAAVVLLGMAAILFFQRQQIKQLMTENANFRAQLSQMASLSDGSSHLADELKAINESSQANQKELMKLRGQAVRFRQLEQENAQLKSQRQQAARQMQQARVVANSFGTGEVAAVSKVVKEGGEISNANTTDLGMLELSDGAPTRFDLGGGTNCVVTPSALSDGNLTMQIRAEVTNTDGTTSELATSRITARPGQHCSISVGDRMIALAVKLKPE